MSGEANNFTGLIGEHLVVSALLRHGVYAERSSMNTQPFDVLAFFKEKILKIQVKTCKQEMFRDGQQNVYFWNIPHSMHSAKSSSLGVDIFAFVALDRDLIYFVAAKEFVSTGKARTALKLRASKLPSHAEGSLTRVLAAFDSGASGPAA